MLATIMSARKRGEGDFLSEKTAAYEALSIDEGIPNSNSNSNSNEDHHHHHYAAVAVRRDRVLRNFTTMSILFSSNHGCVVACLALATSRLGSVGAWQSGILYLTYTLSALLGATYIVKQLGARNSLVLGMSLYVAYVGCFVVALQFQNQQQEQLVRLTAYSGAAIGGIGAGFLWTAQGAYFSQAAEQYTALSIHLLRITSSSSSSGNKQTAERGLDNTSSTGLLAGIFAFWYLAEEVALRLLSTFLLEFQLASWEGIFSVYTIITILSAVAMMLGVQDFSSSPSSSLASTHHHRHDDDEKEDSPPDDFNPFTTKTTTSTSTSTSTSSIWYMSTAAIRLLLFDPKMKYMIGLNAAYGFASAFLNSYVNGEVVSVALGGHGDDDDANKWLGLLTAWGSAVAALLSLYWRNSSSTSQDDNSNKGNKDNKGSILIAGALCFGLVGTLFVAVPNVEEWGWRGLVLVYSLMGVGRATFEGTLKATFADYFAYEKEGAFANIILQNGLSGSIGYILTFSLPCSKPSRYCVVYRDGSHQYVLLFELIVIVSSIAGVLGYRKASRLHWEENEKARRHDTSTDIEMIPSTTTIPTILGDEGNS